MLKRFKATSACIMLTLILLLLTALGNGGQTESSEYAQTLFVREASLSEGANTYTVANSGQSVSLMDSSGSVLYDNLTLALSSIPDGAKVVFCKGFRCEGFSVKRSLTLSGDVTLTSGNISIENAAVTLDGISLLMGDGSLLLKGAEVTLLSGSISSQGCAVMLEYSMRDSFLIKGGRIEAAKDGIVLSKGQANVLGGEIVSRSGYAVNARATLTLGNSPTLVGESYDVFISEPIINAGEGESFSGSLDILTDTELKKGTATPIILNASGVDFSKITVSDEAGTRYKLTFLEKCFGVTETDFLCVYMPFTIRFYDNESLLLEYMYLKGELPIKPSDPTKEGYTFLGWYKDYTLKESYSFADGVESDLSIFASFSLTPPSYEILPLDFTYDGKARTLLLTNVTHQLADEGSFSYEWYKDSLSLGVGAQGIKIMSVSDSGAYKCKLTFSYNGDFVSTMTPEVSVVVAKRIVEPPTVSPKEYCGAPQTPEIAESIYYTYTKASYTDVGVYGVTLTLNDTENCAFSGTDSIYLSVSFEIYKAQNWFYDKPEVGRAFVGTPPDTVAHCRFGEYVIQYYVGGVWSGSYPDATGEYMLRAVTASSDNYEGAVSEAVLITVENDSCVGIGFDVLPYKTEYIAFEKIDLSGASIYASYLSGKRISLDSSQLSVIYKTSDSLRVFDRSVTLSFEGASLPLTVSVLPREYDTSAITLDADSFVFNGKTVRPKPYGEVIGLDGIPLSYSVRGGAVNVGEYTAYIDFYTESFNYITPDSLSVSFRIIPLEVEAKYGETSFVFDGSPKIPSGYFISVSGERVELLISGAMTDAGHYTGVALSPSENYLVTNSEIDYVISKATLDLSGAYWSHSSFVYDGNEHSVSLLGLPDGVSVIGYAGRSATDVGEYQATASLLYDERNYISDGFLTYAYEITPASYDMSGIVFLDSSFVYNGKPQIPNVSGILPTGFDGSSPTYSFSVCPTDVTDGAAYVTVSFSVSSKNYLTPEPRTVKVTVVPKQIEVIWSSLSFVYDGTPKLPTAYSDDCEISVSGCGIDAGGYVAKATASSKNYNIINPAASFVINKRNNSFTEQPSILGGFVGDALRPEGKAQHGEVVFSYYLDKSLTRKAALPLAEGEYYMIAEVPEDNNYKRLSSSPIAFTVSAVVPTSLSVTLRAGTLHAYEKLNADKVEAVYINNNGSHTSVPFSSLTVEYENESSLRVTDSFVNITAGGFTVRLSVSVERASYDMSCVKWSNTRCVYDGLEKESTLTGLPSGVSVIEYTRNKATGAGVYLLSAILSYDEINYYPPILPNAYLVIEKQGVTLPNDAFAVYDGEEKRLVVPDTEYYKGGSVLATKSGSYTVSVELYDKENYVLDGQKNGVSLTILPRELKLRVLDKNGGYVVDGGNIIDGDELGVTSYEKDGFVYISIQNPNYSAEIIPLEISKANEKIWIILLVILTLIILSVGGYIVYLRRAALCASLTGIKVRLFTKSTHVSTASYTEEKPLTLLAVDAKYADGAISDAMAKDLIRKSKNPVITKGAGKHTIALCDISSAFSSGDKIDINVLKAKGLIPENCSYIKVEGIGIIDKALHITADAFSLCAVKMIALTGGTACRARTKIEKN